MKIKILEIIDTLNIGGVEKVLVNLVSGIDKDKFEILVLPLLAEGRLAEEIHRQGIEIINLRMKSRFDLKAVISLYRLLKERGIDIVHTHLASSDLVGGLAGKLAGIKVVSVKASMGGSGALIGKRPYLRDLLTRLLSLFADRLIVPSPQVKEWLVGVGVPRRKIAVIYHGVNPAEFNPGLNKIKKKREFNISGDEKVVGMVARLEERKDHKTFLLGAKDVLKSFPRVKFLLVGDGPMREDLENFAARHQIEEQVIFAGEREDVPEILSICDILALSSISEGLGLVLLEGMAAGVPVVATAVGGVPEIIEDGENGLLVSPGTEKGLAGAIVRLLKDERLSHRLRQRAKERVSREFSHGLMVKKHEILYESLARENRRNL